ncbi:MAG: L,D-transpeptidase [Hyphomicrobium sp.]|jgi:lipoprotein-anchoring transpeptidase ErfK/SrfK
MIWRAALAAATVITLADVTPALAQFYGDDAFGRQRFWEPRPHSRQWRNDYGDQWGDSDDRRSPVVRSGGARPAIAAQAPPKVRLVSNFPANAIVIDSAGRMLYFILSPTEAYQYPISVGREGFSWTGTEVISRKQEWPDWNPPKEMIARDPRLPDKMTGGIKNPLGALALYLGDSLYRIHGTNDPKSIGRAASSGCFRMMNEHVLHLAALAWPGTQVTVVKSLAPPTVSAARQAPPARLAPPSDPYADEWQDDPYTRPTEPYSDDYDGPRDYDRYQRYDRYGDPL